MYKHIPNWCIVLKDKKLIISKIVAIIIIEYIFLGILYYTPSIGVGLQLLFGIISLIISGSLMRSIGQLKGFGPLYIAGTKRGIQIIDAAAKKNKWFWDELPMWGVVLAFGLLSYPLLKGRINKKTYILGIVSLIVLTQFILPYMQIALQFITLPQIQSTIASASSAPQSNSINPLSIIALIVSIIAGMSGYLILFVLLNALLILNGIWLFITSVGAGSPKTSYVTSQVPGVVPVIPGIDLPFAAGIISLAILLIIHEFSHGVLARKAKIKVKSVGILGFSVIPVGGFVEPDDKQVKKLDPISQTKIFAAGISMNFLATLVFFVLLMVVALYLLPGVVINNGVIISAVTPHYPAYGILKPGMHILKWNNQSISSITNLTKASASDLPGSVVSVSTNTGNYTFIAKASNQTSKGLIGVNLYQSSGVANGIYPAIIYFLYTVFALSFMLNFLVAVVNLLPIPLFDGMWIYNANITNKRFIRFMYYFVIILLAINIFQWVFYL